jgi:hypothetical protein
MTNNNENIDFDSLLDLENQFYNNSYNNAYKTGESHTFRDGKQFGIQTGFQRFVLIGALKKLLELLKNNNNNSDNYSDRQLKSIDDLLNLLNSFYNNNNNNNNNLINSTNNINDVNYYEKNIKLIKSKIKVLFSQLGYKSLYSDLDSSCIKITGIIPVTQLNISDENDIW